MGLYPGYSSFLLKTVRNTTFRSFTQEYTFLTVLALQGAERACAERFNPESEKFNTESERFTQVRTVNNVRIRRPGT